MRHPVTINQKLHRLGRRVRRKLVSAAFRSGFTAPDSTARPVNRVVMFHNGRSGSSVVADLLDQHSLMFWDGEIMKPPRWKKPGDLRAFLAWSVAMTRSDNYGFETKFYHMRFHGYSKEDYISMLEDAGFDKFLVLCRKNYLRGLLSSLTGRGDSKMHIPVSETPKLRPIHVEVEQVRYRKMRISLLCHLNRLDEDWRDLEALLSGRQSLWLNYEDHVFENPVVAYNEVCDFLGLARQKVSVRLGRTNPFPLNRMIINYDEVAGVLAGTRHEWMLTE